MDAFVGRIRDALQPLDGVKSVVDSVREMPDVPENVRERVLSYLERA
jgi:hypothetical protein